MSSAWSQLEQLLTCAICLDRFRNPKLLPCQHTFCADPCMEGLQDYARRQIKCPECRAEHRMPYNGIQSFPTNVTLVRFLELHRGITGEEPEPPPSSMERCNVCSEKALVVKCSHCEKKICEVCKDAHLDIMRREISRLNNQVRRGLNRLNDTLAQNSKNQEKLTHNCALVKEELDDLINRYIKDLQVIQDKLKSEIDNYLEQELKQLARLAEDVDTELQNITSNCDDVEKYVNDDTEWTDSELVEYKEIFGKSLDFLRNFDPDTSDFTRRVKLQIHTDPDALHRTLSNLGELKFNHPPGLSTSSSTLNVPQHNTPASGMNALMRSQSDHRLAVQFQKKQDGRNMLDIGQRYGGHLSDSERDPASDIGSSLYGRGRNTQDSILRRYQDRSREDERDTGRSRFDRSWRNEDGSGHHAFRSRYARELMEDDPDSSSFLTRNVRFEEPPAPLQKERIFDTDDAIRGPLSGVVKLSDCAKFMERIHENEIRRKQKEAEKERQEKEPPPPSVPVPPPRRPPSRQISEDQVEKEKKAANQAAASSSSTTEPRSPPPTSTPVDTRPSQVRRLVKDEISSRTSSPAPSSPRQGSVESTPAHSRRSSTASEDTTVIETGYRTRQRRSNVEEPKVTTTTPSSANAPSRSARAPLAKNVSIEHERRPNAAAEKREEHINRTPSVTHTTPSQPQLPTSTTRARQAQPAPQQSSQVTEEDGSSSEATSSEETTESEEEDEEEEEEDEEDEEEEEEDITIEERTSTTRKPATPVQPVQPQTQPKKPEDASSSSVSALLNRSAQARRGSQDVRTSTPPGTRRDGPNRQSQYAREKEEESKRLQDRYRSWRESPSASAEEPPSRYQSSYLANRRRPTTNEDDDEVFGTSRFLSRSKSSALIGHDDDSQEDRRQERRRSTQETAPPSSAAAALRRSRLSRSKSSNEVLPGDLDSPEDTTSLPYRSRYGSEDATSTALSRSRSSHAVKEPSPDIDRNGPGSSSTWAQYLRNKYGNRGGASNSNRPSAAVSRSRSSHTLYGRSGSDDDNSSDEEIGRGRRRSHGDGMGGGYGFPRSMYLQKKRMQLRIGTRGTEPGYFTWPRGVAVGPDNSIVVADSSNHRVQVFDNTGRFQHEFGTYGSSEGEFDCLAGVAVNRIGQFIVSDRYNHRIQVFDPSGRFLRSFGCEGRVDGRFNYPWGITTDSLGFIYVCDKENHRVQVFQSDGTFVGKFGTLGSRPGQLEHPHYVAVSNTNRVIVSDSNNHRIQIFDVNGRSLSSFGSEGSDEGHFKFPRGVAVDDQGYIIVGDSGNNRIQIFAPDGSFLRAFGSWGCGDGEFKGLEGIAVMPSGNIVVCDRENHRVQVF